MDSLDRLLTELQETGQATVFGTTTLGEIVYLCDTLGLNLSELLISGRMNYLRLTIKGGTRGA